jgi:hypothetical protein
MGRIIQPFDDEFTAWREFARRHRGNPSLELDPLYALPEPLIDLIQRDAPGLLIPAAEAFERDLVRTAHGGFFLRRPFDCLLLSGPPDERQAALDEDLRELQAGLMEDAGTRPQQIQRYFDGEKDEQQDAEVRRLAYCGWLLLNDQFRQERDTLREYGKVLVTAKGGFPALPRALMGKERGPIDPDDVPFHTFYRRWGLERLITWDLPCPLEPELSGVVTHDWATLGGAGVSLFVPWYRARDKKIRLDQLVERLAIDRNPGHLRGWLEPKSEAKSPLGYVRLGNLVRLYRFRWLALAARYPLSGLTERLDEVFAEFLGGLDAQSIRKLRLAAKGLAGD